MIRVDPDTTPRLAASLLAVALACTASLLKLSGLVEPWDRVVYDSLLQLKASSTPDDILIVAIDDESLRRLGRWPWSRAVHAQLLERLTAAEATAVGFDVLFIEPESTGPVADERLAEATARNGRVVLALAPVAARNGGIDEVLPLPELARAAAALGHVDFELDEDGICRRAYLRAGLGDAHWPAFALSLYELARPEQARIAAQHTLAPATGLSEEDIWRRAFPVLIPFTGPPGHFPRVSYADVLNGTVPLERLRDRILLVGSTATGLGDHLATPLSSNHQRMPGVEINANLLHALLEGRLIQVMPRALDLMTTFTWILVPVGLLGWVAIRRAVLLLALAAFAGLLGAAALLLGPGIWQPPVAVVVCLGLAAPAWSGWNLATSRRRIEELSAKIRDLSAFDSVTGLANRSLFKERLEHAVERAGTLSDSLAVVLISLDRFHALRGSLRESSAEGLLRGFADRLRALKREEDLAARIGDSEFAVLMPGLHEQHILAHFTQSLHNASKQPLSSAEGPVALTASMGVALFPRDAADAQALIQAAQLAAQGARAEGGDKVSAFSPKLVLGLGAQLRLEQGLRQALPGGQLELHYQPQVDAHSARLIGFEALLRWNHPVLGQLLPGDFIPIAETSGLIRPIGQWVIGEACRQLRLWQAEGLVPMKLAVNVSGAQFDQPDLHRSIAKILADTGLSPALLELELTETALLRDLDGTSTMLARLRDLGVGLAIDDFGSGYSSLSYLKRLPLDRLKIDRSFVVDLAPNNRDAEIASALISLAHRLQMRVIAEGVETRDQWDLLRLRACDELQGFFFGRPLPPGEARLLLDRADAGLSRLTH